LFGPSGVGYTHLARLQTEAIQISQSGRKRCNDNKLVERRRRAVN
jgi:hypothetical protein